MNVSTTLRSLPCKMLCPWVASNDPGPSLSVIPLPHDQRKLILYLGTYPRHGYLWEQAGFNDLLYGKSSSRTSLPCAMEKSTLSPVSHEYDVEPAPKADWAVSIYVVQGQWGIAVKGKQPTCEKTVFSHTAFLTFVCQKRNIPPGMKQIGPIYVPSTHKAIICCLKAPCCWRKGLYYFGKQGFGEEIIVRI